MEELLNDIAQRRFGLALIRLWLRAESTIDGAQALSRWQECYQKAAHERVLKQIADALQASRPELPKGAIDQPLALICALDTLLGEESTYLPPAVFPELSMGSTKYWLIRRRSNKLPADRQSPNLEKWFRYFRVIPDRVRLGEADIAVKLQPVENPRHGPVPRGAVVHLRISHFTDNATLNIHEDLPNERFHVNGLHNNSLGASGTGLAAGAEHGRCKNTLRTRTHGRNALEATWHVFTGRQPAAAHYSRTSTGLYFKRQVLRAGCLWRLRPHGAASSYRCHITACSKTTLAHS